MGEVHLVGVHCENLRLRVTTLDLQGKEYLLDFASEAALAAVEKQIAGKLHGDGAGAFGFAALENVAISGARYAGKIYPPVIFEVLILDCSDGVVKNLGRLFPGHQDAALQGEAADELSVVGINFGHHVGTIRLESVNFRQIAFVDEEQSGRGAESNGAQKQKGERNAVD